MRPTYGIWACGTDDREKDNAVLDSYLQRIQVNALAGEYDAPIAADGTIPIPEPWRDYLAAQFRLWLVKCEGYLYIMNDTVEEIGHCHAAMEVCGG